MWKSRLKHSGTRQSLSAKALAALEARPAFRAASTVVLYYSLEDEVDTHAFVQAWSEKKRILLPVVKGEELELREYTGPQDLAVGAYHIEEPVGNAFMAYGEIDLIVVPGVAFDLQGHRLGRGKGYYDRLLPRLPHARKIGLCFPFQVVEEVPVEPFDIPMDEVVFQ